MAKATVRLTPSGTWIEIEAATPVETFKILAAYHGVFGEKACGACGSANIRYQHRVTTNGKDIFELKCLDCQCALTFWPTQDKTSLFASRTDMQTKQPLPKNGWIKYERQAAQQPSAPATQDDPSSTPF